MKAGTHRARAIGAVLTETKGNARREHVFIKFGLVADMNDVVDWQGYFGDNKDRGGKTLTERTTDAMKCCGWQGDDIRELSTITRNEVEIVVQEEEFNGTYRMKVRFIQPIGTAAKFMPQPLEGRYADDFAKRIQARLRGEAPSYGSSTRDGEREPGSDDFDFPGS